MANTIEGAVLQINGGSTVPSTLESRELFVATDGTLYYGPMSDGGEDITSNNSPKSVRVESAGRSLRIVNTSNPPADVSNYYVYTDGVKVSNNKVDLPGYTVEGSNNATIQNFTVRGGSLTAIKSVQADEVTTGNLTVSEQCAFNGKILLDDTSYGIDLPETGAAGQLFFVIVK